MLLYYLELFGILCELCGLLLWVLRFVPAPFTFTMPPRADNAGGGFCGFLLVLVVPIIAAAIIGPSMFVHKVEEGHIGMAANQH
jgi:hypothetical protein